MYVAGGALLVLVLIWGLYRQRFILTGRARKVSDHNHMTSRLVHQTDEHDDEQVNRASHIRHDTHSSYGGRPCSYSSVPLPTTPRLSFAARPSSPSAVRPTAQHLSKPVFCCSSYRPYRPTRTDEETKFDTFLRWTQSRGTSGVPDGQKYVIQAVKQVNFGPVEEVRYYWRTTDGFEGVTEPFVTSKGLTKKNTYKNFKCEVHNKFFELNLYQENAFSKHTWKHNAARPASQIDIGY